MSVAESESEASATEARGSITEIELPSTKATVSAFDLLTYDKRQLVQYLEERASDRGSNISDLTDLPSLSASQREDLAQRVTKATLRIQREPAPLALDDLQARLQHVANTRGDSPEYKLPRQRSRSIASSLSPLPIEVEARSSRQELIRSGCRPACSIDELSHILAAPIVRYQAVQGWLSDEPNINNGFEEIESIFHTQFMRWWEFRKSQWDSRGLRDSEEIVSAYVESARRRFEGTGDQAYAGFDESSRRMWRRIPTFSEQPEGQTFFAYSNAVKRRLAPYHFALPLQLKKDPKNQTAWTDWLEYLSFELRYLERLAVSLVEEASGTAYLEARKRLLKVIQPDGSEGANIAMEPAMAQELVKDFIQETEEQSREYRATIYQRHRVEWIVKEARLMETEISQQPSAANTKKRKQPDGNASPVAEPAMPNTRRRTLRSARLTSKKD